MLDKIKLDIPTLTSIHFSSYNLNNKLILLLLKSLELNTTIKSIDLSHNKNITDDISNDFLSLLNINKYLIKINLTDTNILNNNIQKIHDKLFDNVSSYSYHYHYHY